MTLAITIVIALDMAIALDIGMAVAMAIAIACQKKLTPPPEQISVYACSRFR